MSSPGDELPVRVGLAFGTAPCGGIGLLPPVHYRIALNARGVRPPPRSVNVLRVAPPPGGKLPIPQANVDVTRAANFWGLLCCLYVCSRRGEEQVTMAISFTIDRRAQLCGSGRALRR